MLNPRGKSICNQSSPVLFTIGNIIYTGTMSIIKLLLTGIVLGIANVIPGVSGGTMAVVFNVYDRIIALISFNIKKIIAEWKFWLPLAIGMAVGVLIFSKVIEILLENHRIQTMYFFVGLIAGSIPLIIRKIRSARKAQNALQIKNIAFLIISFILGVALALLLPAANSNEASDLALHANPLLLFAAGMAAAIAMIIPGVSGSFLLLAFGVYGTVMQAVNSMSLAVLLPFGIGVIAGLVIGAAMVRFLMQRAPAYTYAAILGLIAGSLIALFPGFASAAVMIVSAMLALLGFFAAYLSSYNER